MKPEHLLLDYSEIVAMLQQYDKTKRDVLKLNNGNGDYDTREHHFKIKDLKDYIKHIEDLSADKSITVTGINIISAAYPDNHPKRNRQTLIFVPTTKIGGEDNVSFDPSLSRNGTPKSFEEILLGFNYRLTYTRREAAEAASTNVATESTASPVSIQGGSALANRIGTKP